MNSSTHARVALQRFREIVESLRQKNAFDLAGIAAVEHAPELDYFSQWIAEGRAGEMAYLERRNDQGQLTRSSLQAALPWAKSVIVCAANYDSAEKLSTDGAEEGTGWIARYAQQANPAGGPSDYHAVLLTRLRAMEQVLHHVLADECGPFQSRCYVDTGPLIERVYARYAGLGWSAKNTCLINDQLGSWLFLATIVTSIEVADFDAAAALPPDRCGSCTRCIDACPTHALDQPYRMDASRCISYLTIEKRGSIAEDLREGIGRNVFGCDICQDVCPWNAKARRAQQHTPQAQQHGPQQHRPIENAHARHELINPTLGWLGSLDRQQFNRLFRGSPVERTRWRGLMRNVAIAMGNSGRAEYLAQLQSWSAREDEPALAEAARWAMSKIKPPASTSPS